ncbi:MAG: hypothetical protein QM627_09540 [Luteolibacter sp.]
MRMTSRSFVFGFTLMEAVISLGVLAVALPVVLGAMASGGKVADESVTLSRSLWMVPVCLREVDEANDGVSRWFGMEESGTSDEKAVFPEIGDWGALAFAPDGRVLREVKQADYAEGLRAVKGTRGAVIVRIDRMEASESRSGMSGSVLRIRIESPAVASVAHRMKRDFYTSDGR